VKSKNIKKLILAATLASFMAEPTLAQMAPAPRAAPRTPVNREVTAERKAPPREVQGQALILDGEKLRVQGVDVRLFGVVPPQLSASFGPQARAALDALMGGGQTVSCSIRDRDHDSRLLLATCRTANGADPAFELLRRGLAVAARGSITGTEFAEPYINAEEAAKAAKIGLWTVAIAAPAPPVAAPAAPPVTIEAQKTVTPPKAEPVVAQTHEALKEVQPKIASSVMPQKPATVETNSSDNPGLFARFQILIAGLLMLITALSILGVLTIHRRREKADEMKALAAALRGELLAARAVCLTRIKSIASTEDDRASHWPRIRSTLYQAYVGRLGWLGAELARQIASIYGQAGDYAAYYGNLGENNPATSMPKRQALQALVAHIEEVLPRLAAIELRGERRPVKIQSLTNTTVPAAFEPQAAIRAITHMPPPAVAQAPTKSAPNLPPPATPRAQEADVQAKIRYAMRSLRERLVETPSPPQSFEPIPDDSDYATLIEEEAERFTFSGETEEQIANLGKQGR
jgi:endonuclease YncB( thermonuclease family)